MTLRPNKITQIQSGLRALIMQLVYTNQPPYSWGYSRHLSYSFLSRHSAIRLKAWPRNTTIAWVRDYKSGRYHTGYLGRCNTGHHNTMMGGGVWVSLGPYPIQRYSNILSWHCYCNSYLAFENRYQSQAIRTSNPVKYLSQKKLGEKEKFLICCISRLMLIEASCPLLSLMRILNPTQ